MSTLVDERIVEMGFDNKNFEKNVKTSMGTIDKLKSNLNFSGISSSMQNTFNSLDTSGIAAGLSNASKSFTAMEIVAISAISNITNRIVDMGIQLVKSLSVDNITVGWDKYAEKTIAVGTLISQGNDIDTVNTQLDKLLWYTDETSYNFTDMVSNLGKFTAAGQELEDSVQAMMGIANWAALSGQNASTASRAMYQLSQAMSQGSVRLEDWRSIQNANMDTQEFRKNALDSAVAVGTLTQAIDGTYTTLSGNMFDINKFTEYLTSDGWLTTDVIMSTLSKYSAAVDDIFDSVSNDDSISTTSDAIKKNADTLDEFGLKAFAAAQEARTFKDAVDSVKEAAASQWSNIFENVFGGYDTAKGLWTDLANELYDVFIEGLSINNEILGAWNKLGGRDDLFANTEDETGAFWNLFYAIVEVKNLISKAWNTIFPLSEMEEGSERITDLSSRLKKFTEWLKEMSEGLYMSEESAGTFVNVLKGVFSLLKGFLKLIKALWIGIQPILNLIRTTLSQVFNILGKLGGSFSSFTQNTDKFTKVGEKMAEILTIIVNEIKSFEIINNIIKMVKLLGDSFEKSGGTSDNFIKIMNGLKTTINLLLNAFVSLYLFAKKYIIPIFGILITFAVRMAGTIGGKLISAFAWISDLILLFANFIKSSSRLQNIFESIKRGFTNLTTAMQNFFGSFGKVDTSELDSFNESVTEKFTPLELILKGLGSLFSGLWSILKSLLPVLSKTIEFVGSILGHFGEKLASVFGGDGGGILSKILSMGFLVYAAKKIYDVIYMLKGISFAITDLIGSFSDVVYSHALKQFGEALYSTSLSVLILVSALILLSTMDDDQLKRSMLALTAILGILVGLIMVMKKITETTSFLGIQSLTTAWAMQTAANAMIKMAIAVAIFAVVLKLLSTIKKEDFANAMTGLMMIVGLLLGASAIIGKNSKVFNKGARGLISMALAVLLLSIPLEKIGNMEPKKLIQGLIGISALVSLCIIFAKVSGTVKKSVTTALGMLIFAQALLVASIPLRIIGSMGWSKLAVGMAGMLGIAGIMVLIGTLSKYMKRSISAALSMTLVAQALFIASIPLRIIGSMGWSKLAVGMAGMLGIAGIMVLIGTLSKYMKKAITTAFAMVLVGTAMISFAIAAKMLGTMSWESLAKAGVAMLGIASVMALIGVIFKPQMIAKIITFSIALTIMSSALLIFSLAVVSISLMSFSTLGKTLLFLAATFVVLGIAALVLKPVVPTMLALSIALLLFASAILITNVAFTILLTTLGIFGATLATTLILLGTAIYEAAPVIGMAIGALLSEIFKGLGKAIKDLFVLLNVLIVEIITFLWEHGPKIIETVVMLLTSLMTSIADYFPTMVAAIISMIITLLEGIRENAMTIIDIVIDILIKLVEAITQRIPEIIDTLLLMVVRIIEEIVKKVLELMPRLTAAGFDLLLGLIDGLGEALEKNAPRVRETMIDFAGHMINAILGFFGMKSVLSKSSKFIDMGKNLIMGLVGGIKDKAVEAVNSIKEVGKKVLGGLKNILGIESPSRETYAFGEYIDEGLMKGIDDGANDVYKSAGSLGDGVLEGIEDSGLSTAVQKLYDVLESDMDGELVIRPVMDLTEIQNGTKDIFGMMNDVDGHVINGSNEIANKTAYSIRHSERDESIKSSSLKENGMSKEEASIKFYNTFEINEATNPKEVASEVAEIMQTQLNRRKVQYGKSNI